MNSFAGAGRVGKPVVQFQWVWRSSLQFYHNVSQRHGTVLPQRLLPSCG
jgi:hypothetical protein